MSTTAEQLACIEREIKMRERVYPRWIEAGKLTPVKAAHEIQTMRDVLELLRAKEAGERLL